MPTLHWIGKEKVINHHLDVPFKVLEHSYGFADGEQTQKETNSGNKIIHGDNLEALKALLPEYEGKIKCIYIDPPYNTGNEGWVYNDNVNDPKIKKWLGQVVGKESEDLSRHDKWLCMMYPRLRLLHKLMAEDGRLVISIGYQEVYNLMPVVKEIFNTRQISCVTVQTSGGKPSGSFNLQHEYLIFVLPVDFEANSLSFTGGISRTPFEGLTLATFDKTQRPNQTYPIFINTETHNIVGVGESLQEKVKNGKFKGDLNDFVFNFEDKPEGTEAIWPITTKGKDCVWRLAPLRLLSDWTKGYIKVSLNRQKNSQNRYSIQYLPEGVIKKLEAGTLIVSGKEEKAPTLTFGENKTVGNDIPTIWLEKEFYSVKGTSLMNEIFEEKKFTYPKPLFLISEVLRTLTFSSDIILDSFAGSGTTAHAVLNLNKQDGGNRKFILVEMEDYAESITAERVKRVIKGYGEESKATEGTGGGFDYYELGVPLFDEEGNLNEAVGLEKIRSYIWYTETKTAFEEAESSDSCHFLGKKDETAYYFFYEPNGLTTLNHEFLATIKTKAEQYVVYADNCLLTKEFMGKHGIIFKKIPRDITRF
jgi:adenine-specific DNA-methyltransferase